MSKSSHRQVAKKEIKLANKKLPRKRREHLVKKSMKSKTETAFSDAFPGQCLKRSTLKKIRSIPQLVQGCLSSDPDTKLEACREFRRILCIEPTPPIQKVIDSGVVPQFVSFLKETSNPQLVFEAAWILTNLASGSSRHTKAVLELGVVPILIMLLRSRHADIRNQAIWALGNIAGDSSECRDIVLNSGILKALVKLRIEDSSVECLRNTSWTISNLCRGNPHPDFDQIAGFLPILEKLLHSKDQMTLCDSCWALCYLSLDASSRAERNGAIIRSGVVKRLLEILYNESAEVTIPATRVVGNLVSVDEIQAQVIVRTGALPPLAMLLRSGKRPVRREACWAIRCLTSWNSDLIQALIDQNIFAQMIPLLSSDEYELQSEAVFAIYNVANYGTPAQLLYLVTLSVIPPLCDLFTHYSESLVLNAMHCVRAILKLGQMPSLKEEKVNEYAYLVEACGGLDKLELAQFDESNEVYVNALVMLNEFWSSEQMDEETQKDLEEIYLETVANRKE